jgi:hypothetical protein
MAAQYGQGLTSVEISPIASDGGLGTAFSVLGNTKQGSMKLTTATGQTTDFNIEEQDDPILQVTQKGPSTLAWECYDVSATMLYNLFGGTLLTGTISVLGAITPGSVYTNGSYSNVPLTGGTGTGAKANITVAGAVVTAVEITDPGSGYTAADSLSVLAANVGGTGSGFAVVVTSVVKKWSAPAKIEAVEKSVRINAASGQVIRIVRASLYPAFNWNMTKSDIASVNMTATILTPTKASTAPYSVQDHV